MGPGRAQGVDRPRDRADARARSPSRGKEAADVGPFRARAGSHGRPRRHQEDRRVRGRPWGRRARRGATVSPAGPVQVEGARHPVPPGKDRGADRRSRGKGLRRVPCGRPEGQLSPHKEAAYLRSDSMATPPASAVTTTAPQAAAPAVAKSTRIAAIDWMRGLVMVLMVIDHASMAFDGSHLDEDSAMYPGAATMALPGGEFFTRWITHICAPTFVFLAGVALALSVERRAAKGTNAWEIDRNILARGALIALLDPTIISLGSG